MPNREPPTFHERKWWKEGVVYQIYPASYKDSNNDGIGDIPGIISKLDYIRDLGVDIIWICPFYKSPQVDMGYDVSDYEDIHEPYGSVQDCEKLIKETHDRGMKIIFDLVVNHCSDQHKWFQESRSSKTKPKRDWFIWRPAKYDGEGKRCRPNNWRSNFTNPAWTWDEQTEEYYLHLYAKEQPDLNWENEDCRKAIYDSAIRFWLDKGVDGFRVDTVNMYSKTYTFNPHTKMMDLPDAEIKDPEEETQFASKYFCNGPRIHEFLNEMNDIFAQYDVMTVGELPNTPNYDDVLSYISARARNLNMVFNFGVVALGQTPGARFATTPFTTADFKRELAKWQTAIDGTDAWTTVFLENHDQGRCISRFASDAPLHRVHAAKMFAILLTTMTGTLFLYQGQEIGMTNAPRSWLAEEYKCIKATNYYNMIREKTRNDPAALERALDGLAVVARDHARVPMQWDASPNAGFCNAGATPWMRVIENHKEINVESQIGKDDSVLGFWKQMLCIRKAHKDLFVYGKFEMVEQGDDLMVFAKEYRGQKSLTVVNLSNKAVQWQLPESLGKAGLRLMVSNSRKSHTELSPYEGRIYI